jgi:hypothetical protein
MPGTEADVCIVEYWRAIPVGGFLYCTDVHLPGQTTNVAVRVLSAHALMRQTAFVQGWRWAFVCQACIHTAMLWWRSALPWQNLPCMAKVLPYGKTFPKEVLLLHLSHTRAGCVCARQLTALSDAAP